MSAVGTTINQLLRLRAKRKKLQRQADEVKAEETRVTEQLMEALLKQKQTKAGSAKATFSLNQRTVCTVEDWKAFHDWIVDNDKPHLLQKRVALEAFRELVEDGEIPAGTKPEQKWFATLTELKS